MPDTPAAEEAHRLSLSTVLRLGTGANWEAIRDRAEDLVAEVAELTTAARRQQQADIVPAADRATTLNEAAEERLAQWLWDNCGEDERSGLLADDPRRIAAVALRWPELRRLAVEARQDGHVCKPGASTCFCLTSGEIESECHGGFDQCCDRPDLHQPARAARQDPTPDGEDTFAQWLAQRFDPQGAPWDGMSEDDRSYWEHQARAVRRAVARGGFKQTTPAVVPQAATPRCRAPWGFPGAWHWVLEDVRALPHPPRPVRGQLGLWTVDDDILAAVQRQLDIERASA